MIPPTSQSAVSPISKSAGRGKTQERWQCLRSAGWKPCDTADWEVCGTVAVGRTHFLSHPGESPAEGGCIPKVPRERVPATHNFRMHGDFRAIESLFVSPIPLPQIPSSTKSSLQNHAFAPMIL